MAVAATVLEIFSGSENFTRTPGPETANAIESAAPEQTEGATGSWGTSVSSAAEALPRPAGVRPGEPLSRAAVLVQALGGNEDPLPAPGFGGERDRGGAALRCHRGRPAAAGHR